MELRPEPPDSPRDSAESASESQGPASGKSGPDRYPISQRFLRCLRWPLRLSIAAYLGLVLLLMFFENSLIFFPTRFPEGNWQPTNLVFEDAYFTAPDGVRLHGWYVPCDQPSAIVLYSHGNGGNLANRSDILRLWRNQLNATVLVYDYRGYGRSEGSPTEAGVLQDARAARAWLAQRAGVREQDIVQFGESLGGAVAVNLAADGARGLVLENTFSSLADVAAFHYPIVPVRWLLRSQFNSQAAISRHHGPLLQIHGDHDSIVPFACGQQLFAAANEPKKLVVIPGGDHNDPPTKLFVDAVEEFLNQLPPVPTPSG
jgi:fermentation-respiration switch protein FrsA (DUF1100 family)